MTETSIGTWAFECAVGDLIKPGWSNEFAVVLGKNPDKSKVTIFYRGELKELVYTDQVTIFRIWK